MKRFFGIALVSTLILVPIDTVRAQYDGISPGDNREQSLTQQQRQILRDNQNLNYRTNQQIFNRRVNNALSECSQPGASSSCQQAVPQAESWKTNRTLQNLQDSRIRSTQGEQ
jgi:protein-disulfide isomerase-like protein with CxxC motif